MKLVFSYSVRLKLWGEIVIDFMEEQNHKIYSPKAALIFLLF